MKKDHPHKKLKQLSDQHEVPFNPAAWDRMEALLDNTPPPEEPRPGASFFNYKNILAMLILLMILLYFVVPTEDKVGLASAEPQIEMIDHFEIPDTTQQPTKEITPEDLEKKSPIAGALTTDGKVILPDAMASYPIDQQAPGYLTTIEPSTDGPYDVFTKTIPTDNFFIEKIKETLAAYSSFRNEEKVYLHFDRTLLKPGESLWFSAYVRNANTLQPSEQSDIVYVELIAPNGGVLKQLKLVTEKGVAKGDIQTSSEMAGGIYKVKAYTSWQKNFKTQFERKITLQKTVLPHLRMELDFAKEAYGEGDEVIAKLDLNSLENKPLANFDFTYQVSLAGGVISQNNSKTNAKGHAELKFNLPKKLNTNDGLVNVMLQYNGQGESISRSIPIVLGNMDLQFFPEGGDMIAGFENKIAFKAINEFGKPADVEGILLNSRGAIVSNFESYHQGMGAFHFNPLPGEKYTAKITKPANIKGEFPLPEILEKGNSLQVVEIANDTMKVRVQNANNQSLTVVLQSQENVVYTTATDAQAGTHSIHIPTGKFPIGIAQLTLFDELERPHAERLVFLNKEKTLDIQITTNKEQYLPREKVRMQIEVKDENGHPVQGQFSVGVTDDKLLSFADDKQGKMLAYLLLESDLKGEINEPNFYFEPQEKHLDKDQNLALDYLMLTHGWRRYTWKYDRDAVAGMIYPNEKAIIAGRVIDYYGRPVPGAVVRIEGTEEITISDREGAFSFKNYSLANKKSNPPPLAISASKGSQSKIYVNNYGKNYLMRVQNVNTQNFVIQSVPSNGMNQIKGKVLDDAGEPLIGANVYLQGTGFGAITDFDGNYVINNVPTGNFALRTDYVGFSPITQAVTIQNGQSLFATATMQQGVVLNEVAITGYKVPLIKQDATTSSAVISTDDVAVMDFREPVVDQDVLVVEEMVEEVEPKLSLSEAVVTNQQISNLPTKNLNSVATTTAGMTMKDEGEGIRIRGSRSEATDYYIDGVSLTRNLLPESEIAQLGLILGGTPSKFESRKEFTQERKIQEGGMIKSRPSKKKTVTHIGNQTIISDEPLVVIDGVNLDRISLTQIKPKDIKAVEVLEGAGLAAIYGDQAKNGVIIIDTKKRKNGASSQALLDYQNSIVTKINKQVASHETTYDWAKKMVATSTINAKQTRDLRIALNASLSKIQSMQTLAAELGRLTGIFPQTHYANRDFNFIEDYEYAHHFKTGFYAAREFYSPKYYSRIKKEVRDDFRPTIFWNPMVETDASGKALLEFYNSDDLTTFKATVEGLTPSGKIGTATHTYFTQMPFGMRTKFPAQVLVGDVLNIPVTISNHTKAKMQVKLDALVPEGFEYVGQKLSLYAINSEQVMTVYLPFKVNSAAGEFDLEVKVSANGEEDSFTKTVQVLSSGFPVDLMLSGSDLEDDFQVEISDLVPASMQATFTVYPSVLSDLSKGMERMIRQPTGCFEQTSSKNYPNLLVLDYLKNTNNLDQALGQKLYDVLEKGYQRLLTFEVQGGGFDWYGRPPAHEGLTAYGLMQFKDLQRVHRVDQDLIDRTAKWLLTRRDGKGGWQNSKRALHSWSAGNAAGNAYITWAMTEAGFGGKVRPEIEATYLAAKESNDAYLLALTVQILHNIKDGRANKLIQDLLKLQQEDGSWTAATTMTRSGGKSLKIETTALAASAIMKVGKGLTHLEKAMKFIGASKTDYGFGSTQSTVLAMKALIEHAQYSSKMSTDGMVTLMIDGKTAATQAYTAGQKSAIVFDEINELFTEGDHDVKVLFKGTETALPYDLAISYNTLLPKSDANCKVKLTTDLAKTNGKIAETIRLTVNLQNTTSEVLPNTIAKIGIPSGLNLQPWQLKELQEKETFDYYEIVNGELVLHYRGMQASETKTIHLDLKANLAGTYEAPASSAYLYYTNEYRSWSKPEPMNIEAE